MKTTRVKPASRKQKTGPAERPCGVCHKGVQRRVVISDRFDVGGQQVLLDGLMPYECTDCGDRTWPDAELARAREQAAVKLRKNAA